MQDWLRRRETRVPEVSDPVGVVSADGSVDLVGQAEVVPERMPADVGERDGAAGADPFDPAGVEGVSA